MENNEINENDITKNVENTNNSIENTDNISISENSISMMADYYYDSYYRDVLDSLNNIETKEQTIIQNQELSIQHQENILSVMSVSTFIIAIIFVYYLVRNMIIVK